MPNWKHYRTALESALDSIGRFDVLTPEELDEVATHLAASGIKSLRDEFAGRAMAEARWVPGDAAHNFAAAMHCYEIADSMLEARDETVEKIEEAG